MRRLMRAATVAVVLLLVVAAPASGKLGDLYSLRYSATGNALTPYDPASLRPSGPGIGLGRFGHAWSLNADHTRLVAATGVRRPGRRAEIRFVDLRAGEAGPAMTLGHERRRVAATAWVRGRVLVVVVGDESTTVYAADPKRRTIVVSVEVPGGLVAGERTAARLVLLLAPAGGIGPATLAVVDQAPRARTVELERISAGTEKSGPGSALRVTTQRPALAVSPSGLRSYVFGGGEPAAAVDLTTLGVRYAPQRRTAALQKSAAGAVRAAATLPDGRIVVWGSDFGSMKSVGVSLVDPRNWSSRVLVARNSWVRVSGGLIFTRLERGVGLRLLHPSGGVRDLFRTGSPATVDVVGPRAFVTFFGQGVKAAVVELGTGRVVGHTVPARLLLTAGQPITG